MVSEGGLEPPRPFGHQLLKLARLPIPPLRRGSGSPRIGGQSTGPATAPRQTTPPRQPPTVAHTRSGFNAGNRSAASKVADRSRPSRRIDQSSLASWAHQDREHRSHPARLTAPHRAPSAHWTSTRPRCHVTRGNRFWTSTIATVPFG